MTVKIIKTLTTENLHFNTFGTNTAIQNSGRLTVESGTIESAKAITNLGGTVVINGGTLYGMDVITNYIDPNSDTLDTSITINGGTISFKNYEVPEYAEGGSINTLWGKVITDDTNVGILGST